MRRVSTRHRTAQYGSSGDLLIIVTWPASLSTSSEIMVTSQTRLTPPTVISSEPFLVPFPRAQPGIVMKKGMTDS